MMAGSLTEVFYELISHTGKTAVTHIGKRFDKAAGVESAPAWGAMPPMPPLPAMPPMAVLPVASGATFAAWPPMSPAPVPTVPVPGSTSEGSPPVDARDAVRGSYADQVAEGVACLACTKGHLTGVLAATEKARTALNQGNPEEARRQWAMAASEIDAMVAIDWSPGKLAASPPEDVEVIESIRACVTTIREQIPVPEGLGLALGSAKENVRFAVSPAFTERDRAEIETRIKIIDYEGNSLERGELLESDSEATEEAASAMREARHVLDRAKTAGTLYQSRTHRETVLQLEKAAVALTPVPEPDQLDALLTICQSCTDQFYRAYFPATQDDSSDD